MEEAFTIVLFGVVIVAVVVAVLTLVGSGRLYDQIGRGGLFTDDDRPRAAGGPAGAADPAERDEEIRQMLRAGNARRAARGQEPLDEESELARLTAPAADPLLRGEIRDLVVARNERRLRQGRPPLDVEAEVQRQLRDLGAG